MKMLLVYFCLICYVLSLQQEENDLSDLNECGAEGDCLSVATDCHEPCGCDRAYVYNKTTGECLIKDIVMKTKVEIYDSHVTDPEVHESFLAKNIRVEADSVFQGVIASAIFFITCAVFCAMAACIYCCRMNYSDRRLAGDVKALAKKLGRDENRMKKGSVRTKKKVGESCTVVVEDAGVFVA